MTATLLGRYAPDSAEWHEARRTRLGGSEIAAVLGLSPWESRFSLWHRKLGLAAEQQDDPLLTAGRYLEDACARWFQDQHPELAVGETGTWAHAERGWQLANPDRLLYDRETWEEYYAGPLVIAVEAPVPVGILECKFSPYADGWGPQGTGEIPVYYRCQTLWYADVFGGLPVHVAGLVDNQLGEWLIPYDPDDATILREAGAEFIDSLTNGVRPDIDEHSRTYQVIREQHPLIDPGDVEVDADLAASYLAAVLDEKAAKAHKQHAASLILDALGSTRNATVDGERVAYRKPNGDHPPYLCPDPAAVKARTPQQTITGAAA